MLEATTDATQEAFIAESLQTKGNAEVIHSGRIAPLTTVATENYPQVDAFYQDGRAVYNFVTQEVTAHIDSFLAENELTPQQLELVITHQANLRLIEKIATHLNLEMTKFVTNVTEAGNTSSVGIPLALAQALAAGERPKRVLLTGFGAGLAYGSLLLDLSGYGD